LDVDDQNTGNYKYDEIGNLISDDSAKISNITWTVYGKIKSIRKTNNDSLIFLYDASGNRVMKMDKASSGTTVTYYAKDASGNALSTYLRSTVGSNYVYQQDETYIYGSSRLGVHRPLNLIVKTTNTTGQYLTCVTCLTSVWTVDMQRANGYYTRDVYQKAYELSDHLGNVRTTFSDQKSSTGAAQQLSYANYYAFGMEMPGKTSMSNSYKYGFNGKEKDDGTYGSGNEYDYGFRIYNPRLGRFLSVDPLQSKYPSISPYAFSGNNPITFKDVDGKKIYIYYDSGEQDADGNPIYSTYEYGSKVKVPDNKFVQETIAALEQIKIVDQVDIPVTDYDPTPSKILNSLATSSNVNVIVTEGFGISSHEGLTDKSSNVEFNARDGAKLIARNAEGNRTVEGYSSPAMMLSHELRHAFHYLLRREEFNKNVANTETAKSKNANKATFPNMEEYKTSMADNGYLKFFGQGIRSAYTIKLYPVKSSTSIEQPVTPSITKDQELHLERSSTIWK
jgi:RHS repeat-associated protein